MQLDFNVLLNNYKKSVADYSNCNYLALESAARLIERLDCMSADFNPRKILNVGSKNNYMSKLLSSKYPHAVIYNLDISYEFLEFSLADYRDFGPENLCNNLYIGADYEQLPFAKNSFDLVISNQVLHNFDFASVMQECFKVLAPGGLLLFASLGPDSFKQLRGAWCIADDEFEHVNRFLDMHILGDVLKKMPLIDPVMDCQWVDVIYANLERLFADLRGMGEAFVGSGRRKSLISKKRWDKMLASYPHNESGHYPVTLEFVFGHALKDVRVNQNNILSNMSSSILGAQVIKVPVASVQ